tara:strand:- start:630 stop:1076 length:447 start_codon:yes stop_codon:yes gene_type:complete
MINTLNKIEIKKILKIKDPFLMVDKVKIISKNKIAEGMKVLRKDDWYFKAHFFNNDPVMPGTLQTEAMLQTTIATLYEKNKKIKKYFIIKSETNFYLKIIKPCTIKIKLKIISKNKGIIISEGSVFLKNKKVSTGKFRFIDPENFKIN